MSVVPSAAPGMILAPAVNSPDVPRYSMYVDGQWVEAADGATYERTSPVDGEIVGIFANADVADAKVAIRAARRAFDSGGWRWQPVSERAAVLRRAATLLRERAEIFAAILTAEMGQPGQARAADAAADTLDYYAFLAAERRDEAVTEQHPSAIGIITHEPVGVVGALTNWNAPLSIAHKACPALAVGCTMVVKPGHQTAGAVVELARAFHDAGMPPGVFNVVTSSKANGSVVGEVITASPDVDLVTFTGSSVTGRRVMAAASTTLKRLNLELGGKSAHVVFEDVGDFEGAVDAACTGIVRLAGQSCQAGSRLLLQDGIYDRFLAALIDRFSTVRVGDPSDPSTDLGPLVSEEQLNRVGAYVQAGRTSSRLVLGGKRLTDAWAAKGNFFEPTIFADVDPTSPLAQEEIFGPVLCVIRFRDLEHAVSIANDNGYGLAGGVWTSDLDTALSYAKQVRTGILWVNGYRDSSVLKGMPAGGFKASGLGREHGREGLASFLETKSIHINSKVGH